MFIETVMAMSCYVSERRPARTQALTIPVAMYHIKMDTGRAMI